MFLRQAPDQENLILSCHTINQALLRWILTGQDERSTKKQPRKKNRRRIEYQFASIAQEAAMMTGLHHVRREQAK